MILITEFIDAAFLRLVWALLVDYLVASGFLFPEQRQVWVEGYVHILNAIGSIVFIAIWLHHANKKEKLKNTSTITATQTIETTPKDSTSQTQPESPTINTNTPLPL